MASPPSPVRVTSVPAQNKGAATQAGRTVAWGSPPGGARGVGAGAGVAHHVASPALQAAVSAVSEAEEDLRNTPGFMGGIRPRSPDQGLTDADELRAVLNELQQLM